MAGLEPKEIRELSGKFVLVRLRRIEDFPFEKIPFDFDMSFAAFFLNADLAVYGRYGSRDAATKEAHRLLSFPALKKAMERVIDLHAAWPGNRESLTRKKRDLLPSQAIDTMARMVRGGPKLTDAKQTGYGRPGKNCQHCHTYNELARGGFLSKGEPFPDTLIWQYPLPDAVGFPIDPTDGTRILRILPGSSAEAAGLLPGDDILALDNQSILSIADIQWVLHAATDTAVLPVEILRAGERKSLDLRLSGAWRRRTDFSWRCSARGMMNALGFASTSLADLTTAERARLGLPEDALALRYDPAAIQYPTSPVKPGDVIVELNGRTERMTEIEMIGMIWSRYSPGTEIRATVLRGSERIPLVLRAGSAVPK